MYNCIVITVDVWAYFKAIAIFKFGDVIILVKLMIAHAGYHLLIVLGSPVPERMPDIVVISQVSDVACQDENIPVTCRGLSFKYLQLSANSRWMSDAYCILMTVLL